ncbi:Protein of unknown function [Faunimonas pinastri]|uniref:DUF3829 domain-containing protein n=1 Tax=Faunimonas pinastri TaxID=1855383 RepID=A0A1H9N771_9HYPH|nr:DUF3829 domain-containing protein [Faunimonas pinastri]SER31519.1 Protein of unknown function [Faunimonas pinastri]
MIRQFALGLMLLGTSTFVAGCDDQNKKEPSQASAKITSSQAEIEKYNDYIGVANDLTRGFREALDSYRERIVPKLATAKPLNEYYVEQDNRIDRLASELKDALALAAPIPEIDAAAQSFRSALEQLSPISHELSNYADSKGYLADKGDKARARNADYLAALTETAQQEAAFMDGVDKRDRVLTKRRFDEAPKDTAAYFRAGLIFYSKTAMDDAARLFGEPSSEELRNTFETDINQVNDAANNWNAKMKASANCSGMMSSINSFLAQGRTVIEKLRNGSYEAEEKRKSPLPASLRLGTLQAGAKDLNQQFNNMINSFNRPSC